MDKILQQMLLKNIVADGYLLEKSAYNKKERNFADELVTVKKGNKYVASICVWTNLYLMCNELKNKDNKNWQHADEKPWIYLSPEGIKKKFNLKSPDTDMLNDDKIDITDLLNDIKF